MTDDSTDVRIVLSGRISFEQRITVEDAVRVLGVLTGQRGPAGFESVDLRSTTDPSGPPPERESPPPTRSPDASLGSSGARSNVERIVAVADRVVRSGGDASFTTADLRHGFRRAHEPLPGNLNRDVESAVRAGLIAENGPRGEFVLTDKAAEAVSRSFRPPISR